MRQKITLEIVTTVPKFARDLELYHVRVRLGAMVLETKSYATRSAALRASRTLTTKLTFPGDVRVKEVVE